MALIDAFDRKISYLRLSLTDRCDLRCFYCLPEGHHDHEVPENWLSADEIERLVSIFAHMGVTRVRLTGGEPLVRRGIGDIARRIAALPQIEDLSLSTNAHRLAGMAGELRDAGVSRLNVSLDTLRPERFREITKGRLEKVIDGLVAAREAGFAPIKINTVLMRGINDDEVDDIIDFCIEHDFTLRFIETMPVGSTGQGASDHYLSLDTVRRELGRRYELIPAVSKGGGPARYVRINGTRLKIGFITPISQHFCETCNRVRLSVDGTLYLCLGQNDRVELRPLLRQGASDAEITDTIREAVMAKPERHEFESKREQVIRFMAQTGG
jgi:cyclic pyranopterin phosphate synthase